MCVHTMKKSFFWFDVTIQVTLETNVIIWKCEEKGWEKFKVRASFGECIL